MKVFRFYPWEKSGKFQVFKEKQFIHHLVWYSVHSAPCYTGVEYCLFEHGLPEPLPDRRFAPHFLFDCFSGMGHLEVND